MKKFLKVLATAAAVAAVVPFHGEGDKHNGEIKGLLWKASWKIDPEHKTQSDINVIIGFNNPFEHFNKESELFADDLMVNYTCEGETVTYTEECVCNAAPAVEETVAESVEPVAQPQSECTCGEECSDKEC